MRDGGSQWTCSTTRTRAGPSDFQSAAARSSALTSKEMGGPGWICAINLSSQSRALYELSYGANIAHPPTGLAPVSRRYQRRASLSTLWRSFEVVEPRGIAPRSTQCRCDVLLLDDGPFKNWSARPDSHWVRADLQSAAASALASRACGLKWGGRRKSHPDLLVHGQELWTLELRPLLLPLVGFGKAIGG